MSPPELPATVVLSEPPLHVEALAVVKFRVSSLEGHVAELQTDVLLSSELFKSLAEQNAKLAQAVEVLRARALVRFFGGVLIALAAISGWFLPLAN